MKITGHQCGVLISVFWNLYLCASIPSALSVLYVDFLYYFHCTETEAALVVALCLGTNSCAGLVASILVNKVTSRWACFIGGLVTSCAILSSAFAPNMVFLMVVLGIISGFGFAVIGISSLISMGENFEERFAILTIAITIARPIGGMTMPLVLTALIGEYGWRGALLLLSGFTLHVCAFSNLMKAGDNRSLERSRTEERKMFDLLLFRHRPFLLYLGLFFTSYVGYYSMVVVAVDVGIRKGFGETLSVLIATMRSACALVARPVSIGLRQAGFASSLVILSLTGLIKGICLVALPFADHYSLFAAVSMLLGLSNGIQVAMNPPSIMETVGKRQYDSAMGLSSTACGLGLMAFSPVVGKISGLTGSYSLSLILLGALCIGCSVVFQVIYVVHSVLWRQRIQEINGNDVKEGESLSD